MPKGNKRGKGKGKSKSKHKHGSGSAPQQPLSTRTIPSDKLPWLATTLQELTTARLAADTREKEHTAAKEAAANSRQTLDSATTMLAEIKSRHAQLTQQCQDFQQRIEMGKLQQQLQQRQQLLLKLQDMHRRKQAAITAKEFVNQHVQAVVGHMISEHKGAETTEPVSTAIDLVDDGSDGAAATTTSAHTEEVPAADDATMAGLRSQLSALERRYNTLFSAYIRENARQLQLDINRLKATITDKTTDIEILEQLVKQQKKDYEALRLQLNLTENTRDLAVGQVKDLSQALADLTEKFNQFMDQKDRHMQALLETNSRVAAEARTHHTKQTATVDALNREIRALKDELHYHKEQTADRIADERAELKAEIEVAKGIVKNPELTMQLYRERNLAQKALHALRSDYAALMAKQQSLIEAGHDPDITPRYHTALRDAAASKQTIERLSRQTQRDALTIAGLEQALRAGRAVSELRRLSATPASNHRHTPPRRQAPEIIRTVASQHDGSATAGEPLRVVPVEMTSALPVLHLSSRDQARVPVLNTAPTT